MKNDTLALNFSNGSTKGKGSHMFIEHDTIYSYGYHFPIARRIKNGYLILMVIVVQQTDRHKSHVKCNLTGTIIIEVSNCDINNKNKQIEYNNNGILTAQDKLKRVRSDDMREYYNKHIINLEKQNQLLNEVE